MRASEFKYIVSLLKAFSQIKSGDASDFGKNPDKRQGELKFLSDKAWKQQQQQNN